MAWLIKPLLILAAIVVVFIVFQLVDRVALPRQQGRVRVIQKFYREARVSTTYTRTGNAMRPITTEQPEAWVMKVELNGHEREVSVPKDVFDQVTVGDSLNIQYVQHRLRRSIDVISADSVRT